MMMAAAADAWGGEGPWVLVVDDNAVNVRVMLGFLRAIGMHGEARMSGREALELLASRRFDAVLMDLQMPEIDGFETTRRLRLREASARTPVIAVTASSFSGQRERCLEAGMDDFLAKPFSARELARVLARWIEAIRTAPGESEAAPGEGAATVTLDRERVELLRGLGLAARALGLYQADLGRRVATIAAALEGEDLRAASFEAHALRGASAQIGAVAAAALCRAIEEAAAAGDAGTARAAAARLVTAAPAIEAALARELGDLPG